MPDVQAQLQKLAARRQTGGVGFDRLGRAFLRGVSAKWLGGPEPSRPTSSEQIAQTVGDIALFLPIMSGIGALPIAGLRGAGLLARMARWGLPLATQQAITKGTTPTEVLTQGAIGAALPPAWAGAKAILGPRGLAAPLWRVAGKYVGTVEQNIPLFGRFAGRLRDVQQQLRWRQAREALSQEQRIAQIRGALKPVLGQAEELTVRDIGRVMETGALSPTVQQMVSRATGLFGRRVPVGATQAHLRGLAERMLRAGAPGKEMATALERGLIPAIERLEPTLTQLLRGRQRVARHGFIREMLARPAFRKEVSTLAKEILTGAREAGTTMTRSEAIQQARSQAVRQLVQQGRQAFPVEAHRFFGRYLPYGQQWGYMIMQRTPEGLIVPEGGAIGGRNLKEATQQVQQLVQQTGLPESSFEIVKPRARGPFAAELSMPAFWATVGKLEKGLAVPREQLFQMLSAEGAAPLPFTIKQPFKRGKFLSSFLQRRGLAEPPATSLIGALERYTGQVTRFEKMSEPLREGGKLYRDIVAAEGQNSPRAKYLEELLSDIAGRPRPVEVAAADAIEQLARQPGPMQNFYMGIAGDPFILRRVSGNIRAYQTLAKLGFRISAPLVNLTQMSNNVAAFGMVNTTRGIFEAIHNPQKWQWLFDGAGIFKEAGRLELGLYRDILGRTTRQGIAASMWLFQKAETLLRQVAAIAGAVKAGTVGWDAAAGVGGRQAAIRAAEEGIARTQFHYGSASVPSVIRSPIGAVMLQFRTFMINQVGFILGLNKAEAARFFLTMGGLVGAGAIPVANAAEDVMWRLMGPNPLTSARRAMEDFEIENPRLAAGLPGLAGVTMGPSAGISEHFLPTRVEELGGPTLGDIMAIPRILREGEPAIGTLAQTIPGLRAVMQGMETYGEKQVRRFAPGDLLYQLRGRPLFRHPRAETPAAIRRQAIPEYARAIKETPREFRRELVRLLPALRRAQRDVPLGRDELVALQLFMGLRPTGVRASDIFRRRYAEIRQEARRQAREDIPVGRRAF